MHLTVATAKLAEIDRDNRILLEKIANIMVNEKAPGVT